MTPRSANGTPESPQPLEGIKVLDLTHYIAGPFCTKLLADYGADVIKVERPGVGDIGRRLMPYAESDPHPEKGAYFLYLNTNKRGVTLNLQTDSGVYMLQGLVKWADVLVENFMPRVLPSLGLSYAELREINPRLVYVSISNFGQTGPYRDYEAEDLIAYAMSGLQSLLGPHDRPPLK